MCSNVSYFKNYYCHLIYILYAYNKHNIIYFSNKYHHLAAFFFLNNLYFILTDTKSTILLHG